MDSVGVSHQAPTRRALSQGLAGSGEPCLALGTCFSGLIRPGYKLLLALGLPLREPGPQSSKQVGLPMTSAASLLLPQPSLVLVSSHLKSSCSSSCSESHQQSQGKDI